MSEMIKTIGNKKLLADYNTEGKKLALKEDTQSKLAAGSNVTIEDNTISSDQLFIATYGTTSYDEVKAAHEAGKICLATKDNETYALLYSVTSTACSFQFTNAVENATQSWNVKTDDSWASSSIQFQPKLTFDAVPTLNSTNPVTSNAIRLLAPKSTRVDTITEDKLIFMGPVMPATIRYYDASYEFGLHYGILMKLLFHGSVGIDTTSFTFKLLNAANIFPYAVNALRASICVKEDGTYRFAIWLDHSAIMYPATYFTEYYPDNPNHYGCARHLETFDKTEFVEIKDLTLSYQPIGVPTLPSSGTSVLTSANGTLAWNANFATIEQVDAKQDKLAAGTGVSIVDNVITATGSGTLFTAIYGETPIADIIAANDAGQIVQCKNVNAVLQLSAITSGVAQFSRTYIESGALKGQAATCSSSGWTIVNA